MAKKTTHEEFIQRVMDGNLHVKNGDVEILGKYINADTTIECKCNIHNITWHARINSLYKGSGCPKCAAEKRGLKKRTSGEKFLKMLAELDNGVVASGTYDRADEQMEFKCVNGHKWLSKPNYILAGGGCPYCAGKRVLVGFNDLWTTRPDVAKMLKDPDDGYKYTKGSQKKVDFVCPDCKSVIKKCIANVCYDGIFCPICADGVSYPNKFIRQVMKQLDIAFTPEYTAPWSQSKMYDCYFKYEDGQEYVVEMDGIQHYVDDCMYHQTLKEIQENDRLKTKLANDNGILVIRINCSTPSLEYIKDNILSSKLNEIFDLSVVNWNLCDINAQHNLVKEACDLYMSGVRSTKEIARILHIHVTTARRYLQRGVKFGWCDYDTKCAHNKPVIAINNNGEIFSFDSVKICCDKMFNDYGIKVQSGRISGACKSGKVYKGFIFKHDNIIIQN